MVYFKASEYVLCTADKAEQIARIDQCITALLALQIDTTGDQSIEEYTVDNGQTKIQTRYRSTAQITNSIFALRKLRNEIRNEGNRVIRLIDSKNLRNRS